MWTEGHFRFVLGELDGVAEACWCLGREYHVWALDGAMGTGKTTFVNSLCSVLGVADRVTSPTFALVNEYRFAAGGLENAIFHMDWYRLQNETEAIMAGIEDYLDRAVNGNNIWCLVEWAGKFPALLPRKIFSVGLNAFDEQRTLHFRSSH
jgi:tRNA threonylcarbamoyladenosine biosynthesis protein TsaE